MRLIKCYIENFGKLNGFEYEFDLHYNEIIQNNGWGKTTLATFIKAMFYGMPATTKHKLIENERKKYTPWQGGNYGGYLIFETGEGQFKIERYFGKKDSEDTFKVINLQTGKLSTKYNKDIGLQLFDLDADAYERSTFIPQKEILNGINDKISSKLINMVQGTESLDSYEKAQDIIKSRTTELRKRGGAGKIAEIDAEIDTINEKIDTLKNGANAIEHLNQNIIEEDVIIDEFEIEKAKVEKEITKYSEAQKLIANKKYIEENESLQKSLSVRIEKYEEVLNGNQLSFEELREVSSKDKQLLSSLSKMDAVNETNNLDEKYNNLKLYFKNDIPEETLINNIIKKHEEANRLENEVSAIRTTQANNAVIENKNKQKSRMCYIPLIIALITIVAGGCLINSMLSVSIILFILAFLSICVSGFLYFKNYIELKTKNTNLKSCDENEIIEKENNIKLLNQEVSQFISRFSNDDTINRTSFLYSLISKVKDYSETEKELKSIEQTKGELKQEIELLQEEINGFLSKFVFQDNSLSNVDKIDYLKNIVENRIKDLQLYNETTEKINEFKKDSQIDLNAVAEFSNVDITVLQEEQKNKEREIASHREIRIGYVHKIDEIRNELSELDELESRLEQLGATKSDLLEEFKILQLASEFLTKANDNLSSKYLVPMQDGLNKYLKLILKNDYIKYDVDTDLNVSFETFGKSRELDYLSKGYQEVVDLSIRFALVDSLFEKEKPFIILDDPFANMDKDKIESALKLLKEISSTYQIIYMVCHDSRIL